MIISLSAKGSKVLSCISVLIIVYPSFFGTQCARSSHTFKYIFIGLSYWQITYHKDGKCVCVSCLSPAPSATVWYQTRPREALKTIPVAPVPVLQKWLLILLLSMYHHPQGKTEFLHLHLRSTVTCLLVSYPNPQLIAASGRLFTHCGWRRRLLV